MTYIGRHLQTGILLASEQFPVLLLTGPRQVGKTTLLRHLAGSERSYVTLDDPVARSMAREDPAIFLQRHPPPVLIDEIQYAPDLMSSIKQAVDEKRVPGAFWLTGSQPFHLMAGISETLAGRVAIINLLGLSRREIAAPGSAARPLHLADLPEACSAPDINRLFEHIWRGSMPALNSGEVDDHDLFYRSYVETYIERDIRDLAQVGDRGLFLRFVRAAAARTGQVLNLSDLARDVDISVPTAKKWISILESSYQVIQLRPYFNNRTKRLIKAPKLFFLDTGLVCWLVGWSNPQTASTGAMAGNLLETWVFGEIMKGYWHALKEPSLHYYRDRDGKEVDFVIEHDGGVTPVEVKLGANPRPDWYKNFAVFDALGVKRHRNLCISLYAECGLLADGVYGLPVTAL